MPTSFLDLTNRLLRRTNDVQITSSNFAAVTGIQAFAQDAIIDTVKRINGMHQDWPFNAVEQTQVLVVGQMEYAWPLNFDAADWDSFQLQKDTNLAINSRQLRAISRDEWYSNLRDDDYDQGNLGRREPEFVFPSHGQGFGVSPSPERAYTIKYRYYQHPTDMVLYNDVSTIPSKFDYVIINGALKEMNLFKENAEGVQICEKNFQDGLADMVHMFLPNPIYMYDGRVNNGGGNHNSWVWKGR